MISTSSSPIISIIIPVYNVEQYLCECLDSVQNQTLHDIEIICVNDCSTDGSLSILKKYACKDERIKIIEKNSNEGLSTARNVGMAAASGKYILFVDSDDYIDRDLCRKVVNCAEINQVDLVIYDFASFLDKSSLEKDLKKESSLTKVNPSDKIALLNVKAYAWTKLIRSDTVRKLDIHFPDGLLYEDIPVHWILITMLSRIALLPERLCYYRQRIGSIGMRTDWKLTDFIFVYDHIRQFLKKENIYNRYRDIFLNQELNTFYVIYDTIDYSLKSDALKLIYDRMSNEHWVYIYSKKLIDWRVGDLFLAMHGSVFSKLRRILWCSARDCYRFIGKLVK